MYNAFIKRPIKQSKHIIKSYKAECIRLLKFTAERGPQSEKTQESFFVALNLNHPQKILSMGKNAQGGR